MTRDKMLNLLRDVAQEPDEETVFDRLDSHGLADYGWPVVKALRKGLRLMHARGWRYGAAPASGFSTNYREQYLLPGTSMMEVVIEETGDRLSVGFAGTPLEYLYDHRPVRWYEGIFIGFGPDGEPLIWDPEPTTPGFPEEERAGA